MLLALFYITIVARRTITRTKVQNVHVHVHILITTNKILIDFLINSLLNRQPAINHPQQILVSTNINKCTDRFKRRPVKIFIVIID